MADPPNATWLPIANSTAPAGSTKNWVPMAISGEKDIIQIDSFLKIKCIG
jgi:hypothetical protein